MFRKFLYPISVLYGFGAIFRRFLYEFKVKQKKHLSKKVLSVGNLSVGGSGKTPVTIEIANYFKSKNLKPVVLSRGYKRKSKEETIICNKEKNWQECGDEPYLMVLKDIDVVVGKDRYKSGLFYMKNNKADIFILDDGYQHFQLYRDFDILIIDATKPFWEDFLLPVGNLREPKFFYRFADCFIITRLEFVDSKEEFLKRLQKYKKPFFIAESKVERILDNFGNVYDFEFLNNKNITVFSGLGNNSQFFKFVEKLSQKYKFNVERTISFPDHFDYKDFKPSKDKIYLTTEKDLVKLNQYDNIYGLSYKIVLPKEFYQFLEEKLWKTQ